MTEEEFTTEEIDELKNLFGVGSPAKEEKQGIYNFFNKILKSQDTIKVSNMEEEELNSVRVLRNAALYAEVMGLDQVQDYLIKKSGVTTDSALSKKGFLVKMAVTTKKESQLRTKTGEGGAKKSWFSKKKDEED
jgi:hypothetical protein